MNLSQSLAGIELLVALPKAPTGFINFPVGMLNQPGAIERPFLLPVFCERCDALQIWLCAGKGERASS